MNKLIYNRRDVRETLGVTNYRIAALVDDGILDKPIRKEGRAPFWTAKQIEAARKRIEEIANPKPIVINRPRRSKPLSERQREQIRRSF